MGFAKILFSIKSDLGTIAAAPAKNAAVDGSPGILIFKDVGYKVGLLIIILFLL